MNASARFTSRVLLALCALCAGAAHAVQDCDINGESVNPSNGNTTAGKTGLMQCKDRDSGELMRAQELKNGKFMGLVRRYRDGKLTHEHSVNEVGNMHGRSREFAPNGQTVFDGVYENGSRAGITRAFFENGSVRRVAFNGEGGEKAAVEFNEKGQLQELRCADRPLLAPVVDDRKLCGFAGPSQIEMFSGRGELQTRSTYESGKRTRYENYYRNGKPQNQQEVSATRRIERRFAEDGVKRREIQWAAGAGADARVYKVLEQEFAERGGLVREQRWSTEGAAISDVNYYLNGQPRDKSDYMKEGGRDLRRGSAFFDSGKLASEGTYLITGRNRELPFGSHKRFNEQGRLMSESTYDERGKLTSEKAWDEAGTLVRNDEVFEDGSRKAFAK